MKNTKLTDALVKLGEDIKNNIDSQEYSSKIERAYQENSWFTPENILFSLNTIADKYLDPEKLNKWIGEYDLEAPKPKKVGLIMAGNIPLVGFHDLLSVLVSGHIAVVKLSSKDKVLLPFLMGRLKAFYPEIESQYQETGRLQDFDAVIATGSNNSSRYFEYYFGKYPHIIRSNRSSVAILTGEESNEELGELGKDIFTYFGQGCRNVSKVYVPDSYNFTPLMEALMPFSEVINHNKYANNYTYNKSILLLNKEPHLDNGFLIFQETHALSSPTGMIYYEQYSSADIVDTIVEKEIENIQCVVSTLETHPEIMVPFGKAQDPELWDYADNVDTLLFLSGL